MPGIPYTTNKRGFGPACTTSLFDNNAEQALGMFLSVTMQRDRQKALVEAYAEKTGCEAAKAWLETFDDFDASRKATDALIDALEKDGSPEAMEILERREHLAQ